MKSWYGIGTVAWADNPSGKLRQEYCCEFWVRLDLERSETLSQKERKGPGV